MPQALTPGVARTSQLSDYEMFRALLQEIAPLAWERCYLQADWAGSGYHQNILHVGRPFAPGRYAVFSFCLQPNSVRNIWSIGEGVVTTWQHVNKCTATTGSWYSHNQNFYWGRQAWYAYNGAASITFSVTGHTLFLRTAANAVSGFARVSIDSDYTRADRLPAVQASDIKAITAIADNGSGKCRVTCPAHGFANGAKLLFENVTGTPLLTGLQTITVIDANTFDVTAISFVATGTGNCGYFGLADVGRRYLDAYSDLSAAPPDRQICLCEGLTETAHTLKIEVMGTYRGVATDGRLYLSAAGGAVRGTSLVQPAIAGSPTTANNGSGLVRVTLNAHGLNTYDVVTITGHSVSGVNGTWRVTKIDANTFDLVSSTYTADGTGGTVRPAMVQIGMVRYVLCPEAVSPTGAIGVVISYKPTGASVYEWFGGGHGDETQTVETWLVDGVAKSGLAGGEIVEGWRIELQRRTSVNHSQTTPNPNGWKDSRYLFDLSAPYTMRETWAIRWINSADVATAYCGTLPAYERDLWPSASGLYHQTTFNKARVGTVRLSGADLTTNNDAARGQQKTDLAIFYSDAHDLVAALYLPQPGYNFGAGWPNGTGFYVSMVDRADGVDKFYAARVATGYNVQVAVGDQWTGLADYVVRRVPDAASVMGR